MKEFGSGSSFRAVGNFDDQGLAQAKSVPNLDGTMIVLNARPPKCKM
jgi:hypothetical protein